MLKYAKDGQLLKAELPIVKRLGGKIIDNRDVQEKKARSPIVKRESGNVMLVSPVPLKEFASMVTRLGGRITSDMLEKYDIGKAISTTPERSDISKTDTVGSGTPVRTVKFPSL